MITHVGNVGTAVVRDTNPVRKAEVTVASTIPVGDWLVAWFVTQTAWDISRPTDSYNWAMAWDDKVNPWMLIAQGQHSDTTSGGVMLHLYIAQVQRALVSGDKIGARIGNHFAGTNFTRAICVEQFACDAGNRLALSGMGFTGNSDGSATDPASISFAFPGPDREVLYLHALGFRGPVTDSFTWDSDYTQITPAGSNTGTPNDDRTVRGGFRIAELAGNSDSLDIASTTDRSWVQLMHGLIEVPEPLGFPITPILDNFNRANENPLDNGTWHTDRSSFGFPEAQLSSNRAGHGGSQWIGEMEKCQEVYLTLSEWTSAAVHFNAEGDVNLGNFAARGAQWVNPATTTPQQEGYPVAFGLSNIFGEIRLFRFYSYPQGYDTPPSDGAKLGIRRSRFKTLYVDHLFVDPVDGDGWRCHGSTCVEVSLGVNSDGRLSFGSNGYADDFGGGEIPCGRPFRPQVYRRTFGVV